MSDPFRHEARKLGVADSLRALRELFGPEEVQVALLELCRHGDVPHALRVLDLLRLAERPLRSGELAERLGDRDTRLVQMSLGSLGVIGLARSFESHLGPSCDQWYLASRYEAFVRPVIVERLGALERQVAGLEADSP